MDWNNNNKACVSVWYYLAKTKQLKRNFAQSEKLKMNQLRFWNDQSPEATEAYARGWAEWYVSYVTTKDGAQFESGCNWASTVDDMVTTMTDKDKSVSDLAQSADDAIFFYQEVKS